MMHNMTCSSSQIVAKVMPMALQWLEDKPYLSATCSQSDQITLTLNGHIWFSILNSTKNDEGESAAN